MALGTIKEEATTLESRLALKFDEMQLAREDKRGTLFDEISKSIEILFKGLPVAYATLMNAKNELNARVKEVERDIEEEANNAKDEITRQDLIKRRRYELDWDYRNLYEEIIMEVMQQFNLVRFEMTLIPEDFEAVTDEQLPDEQQNQQVIQQQEQDTQAEPLQQFEAVDDEQQFHEPAQEQQPPQQPPVKQPEKKPSLLRSRKENFNI